MTNISISEKMIKSTHTHKKKTEALSNIDNKGNFGIVAHVCERQVIYLK